MARLRAIEALSGAGIPVTLLFAPVIPGLNDGDMERIVERAAGAGAKRAASILLRAGFAAVDLFLGSMGAWRSQDLTTASRG